MFSSRVDVEEGIVNHKGTRNHLYEGGRAGVSGRGVLRLARR